eukprot:2885695-Pleurochrysis_carterae.AAC.2
MGAWTAPEKVACSQAYAKARTSDVQRREPARGYGKDGSIYKRRVTRHVAREIHVAQDGTL